MAPAELAFGLLLSVLVVLGVVGLVVLRHNGALLRRVGKCVGGAGCLFAAMVLLGYAICPAYPNVAPHEAIATGFVGVAFSLACTLVAVRLVKPRSIAMLVSGVAVLMSWLICQRVYRTQIHPIHGMLPWSTLRICWIEHDDYVGVYAYALRAEVSATVIESFVERFHLSRAKGHLDELDNVLGRPSWWTPPDVGYIWTRSDMYKAGESVPSGCRYSLVYHARTMFFVTYCARL